MERCDPIKSLFTHEGFPQQFRTYN